jgi:hypothetical protein
MADNLETNLDENGRDLIEVLSWHFPGRTEGNHDEQPG